MSGMHRPLLNRMPLSHGVDMSLSVPCAGEGREVALDDALGSSASTSIDKHRQASTRLTIDLLLNALQIVLPILCSFPLDRHGFVFHFTVQSNSSFFLFHFSFFLFHRFHRIHRSLTTATHTTVLFVIPMVCFAEADSFQRYLPLQLNKPCGSRW